jgi:hypothetical protein
MKLFNINNSLILKYIIYNSLLASPLRIAKLFTKHSVQT